MIRRLLSIFAICGPILLTSCGAGSSSNEPSEATTTTAIASTTIPPTTVVTTTSLLEPTVDKDLILNTLCTGIPELISTDGGASLHWQCKRGTTRIILSIPEPNWSVDWFQHLRELISKNVYDESNMICGEGWSVTSDTKDADNWYQALKKVNITAKYCY